MVKGLPTRKCGIIKQKKHQNALRSAMNKYDLIVIRSFAFLFSAGEQVPLNINKSFLCIL